MKKKHLLLTITCILTLLITACGGSTTSTTTTNSTITTTTPVEKTEEAESNKITEEPPTVESSVPETTTSEETTASPETTASASDEITVETLVFDIPADFTETADNYYSSTDSTKASNINYMELPNDGSFSTVNSEILLTSMEPQLESLYGVDLTFTLIDEEFFEVNGYQAFRYSFEYMIGEYKITQMQCIVDTPDILCFITYTNFADEGYIDAFNESIKNIRFE